MILLFKFPGHETKQFLVSAANDFFGWHIYSRALYNSELEKKFLLYQSNNNNYCNRPWPTNIAISQ